MLPSNSIEHTIPEELAQKNIYRKGKCSVMIKVHFNGESYDLPNLGVEEIRNLLKENLPEIGNAEASVDEDTGDITFRTASGQKG